MRKCQSSLCIRFCLLIVSIAGITSHSFAQFTSSTLPIIVINTGGKAILDEPKNIVDMGIIYNGVGNINNLSDPFNNYNGKVGIEIRGSSSQMFPKKQFGIELVNDQGLGIDTMLLGMPSEEDWVLFAPYNDKSLMRDVLAYKLGRDMERYAPRTRYCELVINGAYQGIYVLMEKIKRNKNRVDIGKLTQNDDSGDDVTGGYIIKIDKLTGDLDPGWNSTYPPPSAPSGRVITFLYEYPDAADITAAQRSYIQNFMNQFEQSLMSGTFRDPLDGYAKYIDVDSFIDFFIINEVSKNVDGYRLSTYMHKQRNSDGGKLVMGPIWDFNLGFGNADYCTSGTPDGLVLDFNVICPNDFWFIPFWWNRLLSDPTFARKLQARWHQLRADKFSTETILQYIDSTVVVLNEGPRQRNFSRWPVLGNYVWPNYFVGPTYDSEVSWLKGWIESRMNWLDNRIEGMVTDTEKSSIKNMTISVFPNPFTESLKLEYVIDRACEIEIEVFDGVGKKAEGTKINHTEKGSYHQEICSTLPAGIYYCAVKFNGANESTFKVMKK